MLNEGNDTREGMAKKLRMLGLDAAFAGDLGEAKHVFTHRVWNMRLYHFSVSEQKVLPGCQWADAEGLAALPLPTAMKKARREAMKILQQGGDPPC